MEVIFLRGPSRTLQDVAAQLRGLKGIRKGQLVIASTADTP
jgi:metal-responsive CopG/Arc/MetJ family transcriptional regulator